MRAALPPIKIVHLDDGTGRAACGLLPPYPSAAHLLAPAGVQVDERDVCLTCRFCFVYGFARSARLRAGGHAAAGPVVDRGTGGLVPRQDTL